MFRKLSDPLNQKVIKMINELDDYIPEDYRGTRQEDGQVVYGLYVKIDLGGGNYVDAIQSMDADKIHYTIHRVRKGTVQQFTGIRDINNKKVFVGDRVRSCGASRISGEIIFWRGAYWIKGKDRFDECGRDLLYMNVVRVIG